MRVPPVLTANICGGLGNQLFQVANLVSTSARSGIPMMLERASESSSIEAPRPTYWTNMLRKFSSDICTDVPVDQRHILQNHVGNVVREFRGENTQYPEIGKIVLPKGSGEDAAADTTITSSTAFKNVCPSYKESDPLFRLVGFFQSSQFFVDAKEAIKELFTEEHISMAAKQHMHRVYNRDADYKCTDLALPGGGYVGLPQSLLAKHNKNKSTKRHPSPLLAADAPYFIGMHVRRGDYLRHTDTFEILPSTYYDEALQSLLGPLLRWEEQRVFSGFGKGQCSSSIGAATDQASPRAASYIGLKPYRRLKLLIFTDDAKYGNMLAGTLMTKYPALDAMVVGEDQEREAGVEAVTSVLTNTEEGNGGGIVMSVPRDVLELHMMSHCHDLIIANSSYSWWGAYLNHTPMGRVVAPSKWLVKEPYPAFSHIYEPGWTIL